MSGLELNVKSSRDDSYSSQIAFSPASIFATNKHKRKREIAVNTNAFAKRKFNMADKS